MVNRWRVGRRWIHHHGRACRPLAPKPPRLELAPAPSVNHSAPSAATSKAHPSILSQRFLELGRPCELAFAASLGYGSTTHQSSQREASSSSRVPQFLKVRSDRSPLALILRSHPRLPALVQGPGSTCPGPWIGGGPNEPCAPPREPPGCSASHPVSLSRPLLRERPDLLSFVQ